MVENRQFDAIIIYPNGTMEKIKSESDNVKYYYDIYSHSENQYIKQENENNPSLFGSILASKLIQKGYIVLFLGSLSPQNKEYYHHYLYLPANDLTKQQENKLVKLLEVYSLEGKTKLENINNEQQLRIFKGNLPLITILFNNVYLSVEQLLNIICKGKANLELKIASDGTIEEKQFFTDEMDIDCAKALSQKGYMLLQLFCDLIKQISYAKLFMPLRSFSEDNKLDLEILLFRLQNAIKSNSVLKKNMLEIRLYIGGEESNKIIEFNEFTNVQISIEEIIKEINTKNERDFSK